MAVAMGIVMVVSVAVAFAVAVYMRRADSDDNGALPALQMWRKDRIPISVIPIEPLRPHPDAYNYATLLREAQDMATSINAALAWAARFWNASVSLELFVPFGTELESSTLVPMVWVDKPAGKLAHARFTHMEDGTIVAASIGLDPVQVARFDQTMRNRILAHELGHLLGLAHDDTKQSIMYPTVLGPHYHPAVTSSDQELLHIAYGSAGTV